MRFLLLLLAPALVGLIGIAFRAWIAARMAERDRVVDATVTSARSSPIDRGEGAAPPRTGPWRRARPPCGRYNLHLLFRFVGGEQSCRHCAAIERARHEADAAAAVDAAEQALRDDQPR